MVYRLKDRRLQHGLELGIPDFAFDLNNAATEQFDNDKDFVLVSVGGSSFGRGLCFYKDAIEAFRTPFRPLSWNEYPEVTPPVGMLMQVEVTTPADVVIRAAARYDGKRWISDLGDEPIPDSVGTIRFKEWL